jgi:4-hydroxy-tetrahydrodipicolinate synthase
MKSFGRILTAMVTPFHKDGSVNYEAAAKLAEYLINNGSEGLVVAGSTGEAATLNREEKLQLFKVIVDAVGKKAIVIAGTGSNDTLASVELTKAAEKTGVHGVMLVGPYYNKPPQEGFYQHFKTIAQSTTLPVIIYNVPGRTASNILPSTIIRLAEIDNIVAVKEASGKLDQFAEIIQSTAPDFMVYSGDDSLTLPSLAIGSNGIISVAAHIAGNPMKRMVDAFFAGDLKTATKLHLALLPVFKGMFFTTNPIPVKTAVNLLGLNAGPFRLPLINATAQEVALIQETLNIVKTI